MDIEALQTAMSSKILVNKCDICNDVLEVPDNFEERMKVLDEIDNSV